MKESIVIGGAVSKIKKVLAKVEPGGTKPSGGLKLTERWTEHQPKSKESKVSLVLQNEDPM